MTSLALQSLAGLLLLAAGGEALVRGASRLATAWGVSALVVGLTVVAAGTSAPELMVSVTAAHRGKAELALANVVGSNIFNVLAILGLAALLRPIDIHMQYIRKEVPLMIGATALLWVAGGDGEIGRAEGLAGLGLMAGYTFWAWRAAAAETAKARKEAEAYVEHRAAAPTPSVPANLGLVVAGVALLIVGADWLVEGAAGVARALGVSERVIGLTLVAAGTSLPELATSITAALRGERDIALANIVGSNVFNVLMILGATAALRPLPVSDKILYEDAAWAMGSAVALLVLIATGRRLSRAEGGLMLAAYAAYVGRLAATGAV